MSEVGAFNLSFSEQLIKMAKFRNRLVHIYWDIDDTRIYTILEDHIGDFKKFLNSIASFLEWNNPNFNT
jgi:uncharacterized protein YutE (UPF0331/DUF86 family)